MTVREILEAGQRIIETSVKQELRDQGHYLTGALERSLAAKVKSEVMEGEALDYLKKLDEGVPGSQIKVDSKALAEMTRYVELRMGYKGSKAMQVAYRILQTQQREGMPTANSYAYSKNGERKKGLQIGFAEAEPRLDKHMSDGLDALIDEKYRLQKNETI